MPVPLAGIGKTASSFNGRMQKYLSLRRQREKNISSPMVYLIHKKNIMKGKKLLSTLKTHIIK